MEEVKRIQELPDVLSGIIASYEPELIKEACRRHYNELESKNNIRVCTLSSFPEKLEYVDPLLGKIDCPDYCVDTCEGWLYSLLANHPKTAIWNGNSYDIQTIEFAIPIKYSSVILTARTEINWELEETNRASKIIIYSICNNLRNFKNNIKEFKDPSIEIFIKGKKSGVSFYGIQHHNVYVEQTPGTKELILDIDDWVVKTNEWKISVMPNELVLYAKISFTK